MSVFRHIGFQTPRRALLGNACTLISMSLADPDGGNFTQNVILEYNFIKTLGSIPF